MFGPKDVFKFIITRVEVVFVVYDKGFVVCVKIIV